MNKYVQLIACTFMGLSLLPIKINLISFAIFAMLWVIWNVLEDINNKLK